MCSQEDCNSHRRCELIHCSVSDRCYLGFPACGDNRIFYVGNEDDTRLRVLNPSTSLALLHVLLVSVSISDIGWVARI
jgi:hypothetical protein